MPNRSFSHLYNFIIPAGFFLFALISVPVVVFAGIALWPILPWVFAAVAIVTPVLLILNIVLGALFSKKNQEWTTSPHINAVAPTHALNRPSTSPRVNTVAPRPDSDTPSISEAKGIIQQTCYTQIKEILEWLLINKRSLVTRKTLNSLEYFISNSETSGFITFIEDSLKELGSLNCDLLTEDSLAALVNAKQKVQFIRRALYVFSEYNSKPENTNKFLLTADIFQKLIASGPNAAPIAQGLVDLRFSLRAKENFQLIYVLDRPESHTLTRFLVDTMVPCVNLLDSKLLLTPTNRQLLLDHHRSINTISSMIRSLDEVTPNLLTQPNLDSIRILLQQGRFNNVYTAFMELSTTAGGRLVTQNNLQLLFASGNPLNTARAIIRDHAIQLQAQAALAHPLRRGAARDTQSTHIKSVHKSTSKSATRLMERYGERIKDDNLQSIHEQMTEWSEKLSSDTAYNQDIVDLVNKIYKEDFDPPRPQVSATFIFDAIKACIPRLIQASEFTDPVSRVTVKQLMALAWTALHDATVRTADLKDGLTQLAVGFCEIETEYKYPGEVYRPACPGGTFNKIIQSLVGSHPDAKLLVLTEGAAAENLQSVVREEARKYLATLADNDTEEKVKEFNDLITAIEQDGFSVIWDKILKPVEDKMRKDFGSVYEGDGGETRLQGLITMGPEVDVLNALDDFKKGTVSPSPSV